MNGQSRLSPRTKLRFLAATVFVLVVPAEIGAGRLAYHTVGELASAGLLLLVGVNVPILVLSWWRPLPGALAAIALCLALVPYQVGLGLRWMDVQGEATRIVAHAWEAKCSTGSFPKDLATFEPSSPRVMRFLQYRPKTSSSGFVVSYYIGTRSTSHWYDSESGWSYYPD